MPCIFCIAVFAMIAGAVTTAVLDELQGKLDTVASTPVRRTVDSGSVAKYEFDVAPRKSAPAVPVTLTVFKAHKRVRLQVLTHALPREQVQALEDRVAAAAGLTIVDRSTAEDEAPVREVLDGPAVEQDSGQAVRRAGGAVRRTPNPPLR